MSRIVVIGGGPSGVRAAATLRAALLLDPSPVAGGVAHPDLPEGLGMVPAERIEPITRQYRNASRVDDAWWSRALLSGGELHRLPLSPREVMEVFPEDRGGVLRGWARARMRNELKHLIGGGYEERTYSDWIRYRFGDAALEGLFAPYAQKRWGQPEALGATAALQYHSLPGGGSQIAVGETPEDGWARLTSRIEEIQTGVEIQRLVVTDGQISGIVTGDSEIAVEGPLYSAAPVARVVQWLGEDAHPLLQIEAARLRCRHRIQVGVEIDDLDLPAEIHVPTLQAPFYRLTRPGLLYGDFDDRRAVAHLSVEPTDGLWRGDDSALCEQVLAGLQKIGVQASGGRVSRLPDHDPNWEGVWHPLYTRVLLRLESLGLRLVGRAGTHRRADPAQEIRYVDRLKEGDAATRELLRTELDPPVLVRQEIPSIGRFVER